MARLEVSEAENRHEFRTQLARQLLDLEIDQVVSPEGVRRLLLDRACASKRECGTVEFVPGD